MVFLHLRWSLPENISKRIRGFANNTRGYLHEFSECGVKDFRHDHDPNLSMAKTDNHRRWPLLDSQAYLPDFPLNMNDNQCARAARKLRTC